MQRWQRVSDTNMSDRHAAVGGRLRQAGVALDV